MSTLPHAGEVFVERYRLHEVLGEGGFARVFRATDLQLARDVAIKVLKPADDPGSAPERFLKEMKVVAAVRDPHVVKLFDYGRTADGVMFMVLELIAGRDLDEVLSDPLSEDDALRVMTQVLEALRAAHRAGTLHRDVKPSNIRIYEYMDDPWRVKLLDFGIARALVDDASLTATGMAVGTPRFMAPEQLFGEDLGPTTDLYSLAVVTYEMLTGKPLDHMRRVANEEAIVIDDPRIRAPLRAVLNRMLARRPADRFPTADQILIALGSLPTTESALSAPTSDPLDDAPTVQTAAEPATRKPAATTQQQSTPKTSSRSIRMAVVAPLAVLAGAGAGLLILAISSDDEEPPPATQISMREHTLPLRAPPVTAVEEPRPPAEAAPDAAMRSATSGCGTEPPRRGTVTLDSTIGLRQVSWLVHIPKTYDPAVPTPSVLLFHDDASNPRKVLDNTHLHLTAEEEGFVIIAPRDKMIAPVWTSSVFDDVRVTFEETAARLCLDRDRVFAVGHGSGGNAVSRLTCQDWVRGFVLASYIPGDPSFRCAPTDPAAVLYFAPMNTGFQPPDGGKDCAGGTKISYDEYEQMWRQRNRTTGNAKIAYETPEGTCRRWEGEAPFTSCRVKGGRPWPGARRRTTDFLGCDGPPPKFDYNGVLWDFLSSLGR